MLFNSFAFLIFFTVFYTVFYYSRGTIRQLVLFLASCIFYAWFIPKYLLILFLAIAIDYYAAIKIEEADSDKKKKIALILGVVNTSLILFVFKYHNFFIDNINFISGLKLSHWSLILPIGLSFHTFQSLSYVIDVYWGKVKAERNILIYANYVMMFPQLVAGPIERAGHLIPQIRNSFYSKLSDSDFVIGSSLFFYGLFKKVVVADNIGPYVSAVFDNYTHHNGATMFVGTMFFAIQIYADFSGYSDMAIGVARTLGFKFNDNFQTPYFSRSVTEFWRRWHISLSSWLRDYLYYPLVLSTGKITKTKMNLSILATFAIIGLWHGAAWTFVIFGTLHGIYLVVESLTDKYRKNLVSFIHLDKLPFLHHILDSLLTFILVSLSFVFFRAKSLDQSFYMLKKIFSDYKISDVSLLDTNSFAIILFSIAILFSTEYLVFRKYSIDDIYNKAKGNIFLYSIAVISILFVFSFGSWGETSFIYFQF